MSPVINKDRFQLKNLKLGCTKSPRRLNSEIQKGLILNKDKLPVHSRLHAVNFVDANKLERRHEREIKDFILRKVLNQGVLHHISGLTCAKDFDKNFLGNRNRKKNRMSKSVNGMPQAIQS